MSKDSARFRDCFVTVQDCEKPPQISILMPIYNCERFIREALLSVLAQQNATVEIIISDDASVDQSFIIALETVELWLKTHRKTHRIILRRGTQRLRRDHLHLLVDHASCDIVCQAHGDDVSHQLRAAYLLQCFSILDLKPTMVFVKPSLIGEDGRLLQGVGELPEHMELFPVSLEMIFRENNALIGATMAWKKSALSYFSQLSSKSVAFGHDRVMTFRAYLLGGCFVINAPLIRRRMHQSNWSKHTFFDPKEVPANFGGSLVRLSFFTAMKEDLEKSVKNGLIDGERLELLSESLENCLNLSAKELLNSSSTLTKAGYTVHWVKDN